MLYADHNFCVLYADRREYNRSVYFLEMEKQYFKVHYLHSCNLSFEFILFIKL